jgi:uncharacterized protein YjgD (DUF1641 family)
MNKGKLKPEAIRKIFVERLFSSIATTDSIIKSMSLEYKVEPSVIIDAITKAPKHKRNAKWD